MIEDNEVHYELSSEGDFIRIDIKSLVYPNAELDWDRNWIRTKVTVKAGAFSGQFNTDLMTTDFENFKMELAHLYENLNGVATFDSLEGQVNIKIKGDGLGHFEADCYVRDFAGTDNKLEFEINFDQTMIPEMVNQLTHITKSFPVSGNLRNK